MSRPRLFTAALVAALIVTVPSAAALDRPDSPAPVAVNQRVIVQWLPGADHVDKVEARADADVGFRGDLGNREFQLVEVEAG
ncbi:MAG TPA: hypothetical protein VMR96_11205, partial [Solirubrobacterales bacterium]|nr:hypothetical protein [Solirubrobacterales bacterium]